MPDGLLVILAAAAIGGLVSWLGERRVEDVRRAYDEHMISLRARLDDSTAERDRMRELWAQSAETAMRIQGEHHQAIVRIADQHRTELALVHEKHREEQARAREQLGEQAERVAKTMAFGTSSPGPAQTFTDPAVAIETRERSERAILRGMAELRQLYAVEGVQRTDEELRAEAEAILSGGVGLTAKEVIGGTGFGRD